MEAPSRLIPYFNCCAYSSLTEVIMKVLAPAVTTRQHCFGINEVSFPDGINRIDGRLKEILNASQWSMSELPEYLIEGDLLDSFMEELEKLRREVA
ncbi:hypothetical protein [Xenorhabdus bharatensis]|uniref:hypothetical protein n=1 Tax=Xenorhabdus bharatensis TaxID=3136256 RepID=UPI0030F39261